MNRQRRKKVENLRRDMQQLRDSLARLQNDEEDSFTSLPDSLQASPRAGVIVGVVTQLQEAVALIDEAAGFLKFEVVFS